MRRSRIDNRGIEWARPWLFLALCLAFLWSAPVLAHRSSPVGSTAGLSIPSVSHGQMVVLAENRAAILALADTQYPTDEDLRRLRAYINLQHFYCLWGLVPGSLTDERSPFNECTHATLAGVRSLLLHLEGMPGDRTAVRGLARDIDVEMLSNQASMVLCRFSDEPFNTADIIIPDVGAVVAYPPIAASILVLALLASIGGWSIAWLSAPPRAGPAMVRAA